MYKIQIMHIYINTGQRGVDFSGVIVFLLGQDVVMALII